MEAIEKNHIDIVKVLIEANINLKHIDNQDKNALEYAFKNKNDNIIKLLLESGFDINEHDYIVYAIYNDYDISIIEKIINFGANINKVYFEGRTPIMCTFDINIIKLLIKNGANLNYEDDDGKTPLKNAYCENEIEVIELLKAHGAKKYI
jgi:ankyrin repeat protein